MEHCPGSTVDTIKIVVDTAAAFTTAFWSSIRLSLARIVRIVETIFTDRKLRYNTDGRYYKVSQLELPEDRYWTLLDLD